MLAARVRGGCRHGLDWARDHFDEARVLAFYRREDLAASWPRDLGDELATLNAEVEAALREHARRRYGQDGDAAVRRVTFALVDVPYAAGRRYLRAGTPPPRSADELVAETCRCVLGVVGGRADV